MNNFYTTAILKILAATSRSDCSLIALAGCQTLSDGMQIQEMILGRVHKVVRTGDPQQDTIVATGDLGQFDSFQ